MWGNNKNQMSNSYGYPQQNQQRFNPPPQQHGGNRSSIPLNPGVALLGLVGQNTIQKRQNNWSNGNQNYSYPTFQPQQQQQPQQSPFTQNYDASSMQTNPSQAQRGGWGSNVNPYARQNSQPTPTGRGGIDLTPPPLPNYHSPQNQWQNHRMQNYALNKIILDQYIPTIFQRWDVDRSGTIEMHEFPGMICELFRCMNLPPPSQNDMWFLMWKFDEDKNGKIDYMEWANMVYTLGGLRRP